MADNELRLQAFLEEHPDIEIFELVLPDVCGGLRGKWLTRDKVHKAVAGELKLPLSSLAFDVWGRDAESLVFETGDNDGYCAPDIRTLSIVPWAERPTAQIVISMMELSGEPCAYDSRHILQSLMDRFKALGLTPVVASEMEFHLFQETRDERGQPVHTQADRVGGRLAAGQTYGLEMMEKMSKGKQAKSSDDDINWNTKGNWVSFRDICKAWKLQEVLKVPGTGEVIEACEKKDKDCVGKLFFFFHKVGKFVNLPAGFHKQGCMETWAKKTRELNEVNIQHLLDGIKDGVIPWTTRGVVTLQEKEDGHNEYVMIQKWPSTQSVSSTLIHQPQ